MWKAAKDLFRLQPDPAQRVADQLPRLGARSGELETPHRRREHVIDPIEWVVHAVRVLEHRLHITTEGAPFFACQLAQVRAAVPDLAAGRLGETEQ